MFVHPKKNSSRIFASGITRCSRIFKRAHAEEQEVCKYAFETVNNAMLDNRSSCWRLKYLLSFEFFKRARTMQCRLFSFQVSRQTLLWGWSCFLVVLGLSVAFYIVSLWSQSSSHIVIEYPIRQIPGVLLSEIRARTENVDEEYILRNVSGEDKTLQFMGTDCGCVAATVDGRRLEMNRMFQLHNRQELAVRLHFRIPQREGVFSYRGIFATPHADNIIISFTTKVYNDLWVNPSCLIYKFQKHQKQTVDRLFHVVHTARGIDNLANAIHFLKLPKSITLINVVTMGNPIELEPQMWRQEFAINLCVSPKEETQGRVQPSEIKLTMASKNNTNQTNLEIPVIISHNNGIDVVDEIDFGFIQIGETRTRRILLQSLEEQSFSIIHVSTSSKAITAKLSHEREHRHWIEVCLQPNKMDDGIGWINIETDYPACPQIRVKVRGMIDATSRKQPAQ